MRTEVTVVAGMGGSRENTGSAAAAESEAGGTTAEQRESPSTDILQKTAVGRGRSETGMSGNGAAHAHGH